MGDIRNKIAKTQGRIADKKALRWLATHPDPLGLRQGRQQANSGHPNDYGPEGPHAMIGTPYCICGAHATVFDSGAWVCEQHTDAAMIRASLHREAWRKK